MIKINTPVIKHPPPKKKTIAFARNATYDIKSKESKKIKTRLK